MAIKWTRKRKVFATLGGVYCLLWLLTATWGIFDVDRAFDREFAVGTADLAENAQRVSIERIDRMANIRDPADPANEFPEDGGLFRFRTHGLAVAPFVVIDEAATAYAPLGGYGGRRVNLWFFGITKWWSLRTYWVA